LSASGGCRWQSSAGGWGVLKTNQGAMIAKIGKFGLVLAGKLIRGQMVHGDNDGKVGGG
jgi:hypothetical protein